MVEVIKRNGTREAFSEEKLRQAVTRAGRDAGLEGEKLEHAVKKATTSVVRLSAMQQEMTARDIRDAVLGSFDSEQGVVESWKRFEERKTLKARKRLKAREAKTKA